MVGAICELLWFGLIGLLQSRAALEAEVLALRHQLVVLRCKTSTIPAFGNGDRLIFWLLCFSVPSSLNALAIVKPETVIRWHHAGFRAWWRWKSRPRGGRPQTPNRDPSTYSNNQAGKSCTFRIFRPRLGSPSDVESAQHRRDADPAAHARNMSVQSVQAGTPARGREPFSSASTWDRHQASAAIGTRE